MPTYCSNVGCRHCAIERPNGPKICTIEPIMISAPGMRGFMLKCNSYKYRLPGAGITVLLPLRKDGLFPGQLPPPREAYDNVDPEPDTTIDEECST